MIVSYNELDALVRKAFRGVGYHWGEAEEAGKASIWLARHGLHAAVLTISLLRSAANNVAHLRPQPDWYCWAKNDAETCPLLAGIMLADEAVSMFNAKKINFANLHAPGILLPFLAQLALDRNVGFQLSVSQAEVIVSPHRVDLLGSDQALSRPSPATLVGVEPIPGVKRHDAPRTYSVEISNSDWDSLNEFAMKTYVPASDHSRLAGAGAGIADSD